MLPIGGTSFKSTGGVSGEKFWSPNQDNCLLENYKKKSIVKRGCSQTVGDVYFHPSTGDVRPRQKSQQNENGGKNTTPKLQGRGGVERLGEEHRRTQKTGTSKKKGRVTRGGAPNTSWWGKGQTGGNHGKKMTGQNYTEGETKLAKIEVTAEKKNGGGIHTTAGIKKKKDYQ